MDAPPLDELLARLKRGEAPAKLDFSIPLSGGKRITAHIAERGDPAPSMVPPAAVMRAINTHVLSYRGDMYLATATEEQLSRVAAPTVFPAGFPCVILYLYPLDLDKHLPEWVYETTSPEGLSLRDIVRCIVATYKVIYAAEECAVGAEAHAARAGPRSLNRGRTNGPFGIWGHDLRDLVLEGFDWSPLTDGSGARALLPMIGS